MKGLFSDTSPILNRPQLIGPFGPGTKPVELFLHQTLPGLYRRSCIKSYAETTNLNLKPSKRTLISMGLVWTPCLMRRWNKNPTLSQNHNLPTCLPTHLPIEFPTYLCASFPTSQALVPTFSFPAFSLPTLPTFSLFLSKITPYLATYLRACLPPSLVLFPTSLAWLREKAKSR